MRTEMLTTQNDTSEKWCIERGDVVVPVQNDLISIIIPVYNTAQYLPKCIDSVLMQDYINLEVVLVDDGSSDESPVICDKYAEQDKRVIVIHKKNGGQSSARNAGLKIATGEYICFVDSDDYIALDMIRTLHSNISDYNADIARVEIKSVNGIHPKLIKNRSVASYYCGEGVETAFLDLNIGSVCASLYKSTLIKPISFIEGKIAEDVYFNFEAFRKAAGFVYLPQVKYYYVYNTDSTSTGELNIKKMDYLICWEKIYKYYHGREKTLQIKASALYARAAMGLLTRMALFGASNDIDEKSCKVKLRTIFKKHQSNYFSSKIISLDRKLIAICSVYFYPMLRTLRRFFKK